ncbi:metallophosphoesterase family protein [Leptospira alexanderi]|uniref:metallophosphoesterase family protein n=1 Tax=Leptospira alexanderi TaxID=100053 RepID=UPI000990EC86|nr:metallophosphoesterase family protein [Leptospira alexanderi]
MKVLVISDIHGNLPALEYVLKQERYVDLIISLGDVVNYGPWSNECVDLLNTLKNIVLISGNHEEAFFCGEYLGTNIVAKTFFEVCYPTFNRKEVIGNYIKSYFFSGNNFVHTVNDTYIYPDSDVHIEKNTFIGHSHRLFSKVMNNYRLVNVGSVGQNRVNIDELNYVIWNVEDDSIELKRKEFLADQLIDEMKFRRYPELCIQYILSKRRQ